MEGNQARIRETLVPQLLKMEQTLLSAQRLKVQAVILIGMITAHPIREKQTAGPPHELISQLLHILN